MTNERVDESELGGERPRYFGDLLALASLRWSRRLGEGVAELGFPGFRRTDNYLLRVLHGHGPTSLNEIGADIGISRQAARKLVDGLEERGYATEERDLADARVVLVHLSDEGHRFAHAIIETVEALESDLGARFDVADRMAATRILRAVLEPEGAAFPQSRPAPNVADNG